MYVHRSVRLPCYYLPAYMTLSESKEARVREAGSHREWSRIPGPSEAAYHPGTHQDRGARGGGAGARRGQDDRHKAG